MRPSLFVQEQRGSEESERATSSMSQDDQREVSRFYQEWQRSRAPALLSNRSQSTARSETHADGQLFCCRFPFFSRFPLRKYRT